MYYLIHGWRKDLPRGKKCSSKLVLSQLLIDMRASKKPSFKSYRQPFKRAGGTQAKKSAKLGRMGCVCWLASLKRLSFWFQIINLFEPHILNWCPKGQSAWTFFPSWQSFLPAVYSPTNILINFNIEHCIGLTCYYLWAYGDYFLKVI